MVRQRWRPVKNMAVVSPTGLEVDPTRPMFALREKTGSDKAKVRMALQPGKLCGLAVPCGFLLELKRASFLPTVLVLYDMFKANGSYSESQC